MEEERDETHAIWPGKGQETSMPTEEPREATIDDDRMAPWRKADGNVMDSVDRLGRKSHVLSLFWHIPVDVQLGGGGCREDFRPRAETRGRRANRRGAADAHKGDRKAHVGRGPTL